MSASNNGLLTNERVSMPMDLMSARKADMSSQSSSYADNWSVALRLMKFRRMVINKMSMTAQNDA